MSADRWTMCPKCKEMYDSETNDMAEVLSSAYGTVSPQEYVRMHRELQDRPSFGILEDHITLREDFSQGIVDNEYTLRYKAGCAKCGWHFTKKINEVVYP